MRAGCAELAELRSAFVDGALNAADYDRVSVHLAGCAACRRDVEMLRAMHDLVRGNAGSDLQPPANLSERLAAIPHSEAAAARAQSSRVSSRRSGQRQAARRRGLVAGLAGTVTVAAFGVTGYLAAPTDLAVVADPSVDAGVEFSSTVQQLPLGIDVIGAAARSSSLTSAAGGPAAVAPGMAGGDVVSESAALDRLRRAAAAAGSVNFVAEQSFVAYGAGRTYTAQVQVASQAGQNSQINVVSQNGRPVAGGSSRAAETSRMADDETLELLSENYDLSGAAGPVLLGRTTTMVQASRDAVPAGRWWVDDENGLILWQQRFDPSGHVQVSTGFTTLDLNDRPDLILHLPPRPVLPSATQVALTVSHAEPLGTDGWACPRDLAGHSLIKLRADGADHPQALHLVFSDGLTTVSVSEQRGRLAGAPDGSSWDPAARAYVQHGASNLASWESGDTVLTVLTDGSPELLARAVAALPHEAPHQRTTMERIEAGWGRIWPL